MVMHCKICGDELNPKEEDEGICEICKESRQNDEEDDYDPGIT